MFMPHAKANVRAGPAGTVIGNGLIEWKRLADLERRHFDFLYTRLIDWHREHQLHRYVGVASTVAGIRPSLVTPIANFCTGAAATGPTGGGITTANRRREWEPIPFGPKCETPVHIDLISLDYAGQHLGSRSG